MKSLKNLILEASPQALAAQPVLNKKPAEKYIRTSFRDYEPVAIAKEEGGVEQMKYGDAKKEYARLIDILKQAGASSLYSRKSPYFQRFVNLYASLSDNLAGTPPKPVNLD